MSSNRYAVILCGGSGTRLWPLSRALRPKQLLCLNGDETLLQQTARRLLLRVSADRLITVTHEDHKFEVKGQLTEISPSLVQGVMAEPVARNTLPAIAWAVNEIHKRDPQAIIGVFPSDHAIGDEAAFLAAWEAAEAAAAEDYLALIGITPTEPATGYGYIQPGVALIPNQSQSVRKVERFVEKPDSNTAAHFVADGYLWNGGMFIFRAVTFMQMLSEHQPQIHQALIAMTNENFADTYAQMPNLSMDYGLAEKVDKIAVAPADMDWSDLGNWDSIYRRHDKDATGNLTQGDVLSMDTQDSLLWSTGGLLATLGVSNLAVIQTPDATLVCDRSRTEDIKQLVGSLQHSHAELLKTPLTVHRPWGTYTVLEEGPNFKIKRIVVNPGAKLSMQMHNHRSEHWVVVSGRAKITNGERETYLEENESTYIPKTHHHRLENAETVPLQIIEVQCGDYVGEDDIVRFEDTYGRRITK
jgi:mannose-1-phosphate guanylyltransferase/mannose-6-phosphate isomerase